MPRTKPLSFKEKRVRAKEKRKEKSARLQQEEEAYKKVPKSFVLRRGRIGKTAKRLVADARVMMLPYTAAHLQERAANTMTELKLAALQMGVSHMLVFTSAASGLHLRVGHLPHGPTLLFKVLSYALRSDIHRATGVSYPTSAPQLRRPPLLILAGFDPAVEHLKTARLVLQQLFPPLQAATVRVAECGRALLFSYDAASDTVELRHYIIKIRDGARDDAAADEERLVLPVDQDGAQNVRQRKSHVRLVEIGPRMQLRLLAIHGDFLRGKPLYRLYDAAEFAGDVPAAARAESEEAASIDEQLSEQSAMSDAEDD